MRSLRCLTPLLLFVFTVPATAGGAAPPTLPVVKASRGTLYLGGQRYTAPFILAYRDGRLTVNGYVMEAPAPPAPPLLLPEQRAQCAVSHGADSLRALGRASRKPTAEILESMRVYYAASPLVARVVADPEQHLLRVWFTDGSPIVEQLNDGPMPKRPDSVVQTQVTLDELAVELAHGHILFVDPDGTEHLIPARRAATFESAVAKVRRGEPLTLEESQLLPPEHQQMIRKPVKQTRTP